MNKAKSVRRFGAVFVVSLVALAASAQMPSQTPRRLVVCLDGTWNSTFSENVRVDGSKVLRPTNTLKTCRAVLPHADREQLTYYENGVGALAEYPGTANRILRFTDRLLGGAYGAGFEGNVESAVHFIQLNYEEGDEVFVFGFSRGAATARAVTRFLEWNGGVLAKDDAYYLPRFFREYIMSKGGEGARDELRNEINKARANERNEASRRPLREFRPVTIKYLGVWDTVMSLGSRFRAKGASTSAPGKSFHAGTSPAIGVVHARQALAVDEARFDFRPEIWIEKKDGQKVEQRWFAGVHSNVGGGYRNDGLANIALQWILAGAVEEGLQMDGDYLSFYGTSPKAVLYDSSSGLYRFLEAIRLRRGKGVRPIHGINADLDRSVLERMMADASALTRDQVEGAKNTKAGPYRPGNVLQYLADQPDLDAYLREHNLTAAELPSDVRDRIAQLKRNKE
ncbi:MAG TPA: DUF2235 domain-containing protein [Thermoanaerobaculia bacterium]|nr:DUF2235 domain-containing protein [Thermoanaerobaculia bacterium]